MATRSTPVLKDLAAGWKQLYPSAVLSGIVGDTRHAKRGGYHISIEDQVDRSDYSVTRPDDKAPPGSWPRDAAAAIDMNLSLADMRVCHGRLVAVWRNRATDPRARYINAHNGWDGTGSPGRYDWYSGSVSTATKDHEWHVHLELRRRYVNDPKAAAAVLSILRGDSPAAPLGGDDMTPEEHKWLEAVHKALTVMDGRNPIGQVYTRLTDGTDALLGAKHKQTFPSLVELGKQLGDVKAGLDQLAARPAAAVDYDKLADALLRKVLTSDEHQG